jgi:hypothetical protein
MLDRTVSHYRILEALGAGGAFSAKVVCDWPAVFAIGGDNPMCGRGAHCAPNCACPQL